MESVSSVGIIGAGVMGAGIAELFALNGCRTVLVDVNDAILKSAQERIARHDPNLPRKISFSTSLSAVQSCDLVIEAVVEKLEVKRRVFKELDAINPTAILATNTSTLLISEIARPCKRKDRVIGMHFYNPPTKMELLEIARPKETAQKVYDRMVATGRELGKTVVTVKDSCGFVGNRVLMPLINEAIWALHQKVATREDIDTVFVKGMHHPMGPLALADFIGLDTCLQIMTYLQKGLKDEKFKPCPLLSQMVRKGRLGKKNGKGFYEYAQQ